MQSAFYPGVRQGRTMVFFLGWGMDPTPFETMERAWDTIFVWDYTELTGLPALPEGPVDLLAWSMGVWAATQVAPRERLASATAVNGTPWPIDATRGIPSAVFEATLANLSEAGIAKFRRRMCGGAAATAANLSEAGIAKFRRRMCGGAAATADFLAHAPKRSAEDLAAELAALGRAIGERPERPFAWDRAIACEGDRIFPPAAQQAAFPEALVRPGAHWAPEVFAALLAGRAP